MANVFGLSSLRRDDESQEGSDGPNQYYAGGATGRGGGSGLSVVGPGDGNESSDHIASIIARAREQAQNGGDAAQRSASGNRHTITFYREGFTVNDGPYRPRSDPANRPFLEAIERGVVPPELEAADHSQEVDINLVDKRQEDYQAAPAPSYTAFAGQGQTMGSAAFSSDVVVQGAIAAERPVVDDSKPTTTLQIRLHNGTRLRETLNLDNTVQDLHAIIHLNEAADQPYTLLAGFPPRPISLALDQTIEAAGLKGAAITQKRV